MDGFLGTDKAKSRVSVARTARDDKDAWSPVAFPPKLNVTDW